MPRQRALRILITAGPTREYIDPVRYLSNDSSGRMGFALARAALARGHRVTLVHGPVALVPPAGARAVSVVSAADMLAACERAWPRHEVLIMAAAVADYTPAEPSPFKRKKQARQVSLRLKPTVDVLARLSANRPSPRAVVVGFALEDRDARRNAERKLASKNLDAIVLNRPTAIGAERCAMELLVRGGRWRRLVLRNKAAHAAEILRVVETLARQRRMVQVCRGRQGMQRCRPLPRRAGAERWAGPFQPQAAPGIASSSSPAGRSRRASS